MAFDVCFCKVVFDDGSFQWYNTLGHLFTVGTRLVVPVNDCGIYSIGTVGDSRKYKKKDVPDEFYWAKSYIKKAGKLSSSSVRRHNKKFEEYKEFVCDISVSCVQTVNGVLSYVTCRKERQFLKEQLLQNDNALIIETYPPVSKKSIPPEARAALDSEIERRRLEKAEASEERRNRQKRDLQDEEDFEDLMEDLDKYN